MPTVLSTKNLKENQKLLLLNAGISLVQYAAIKIDYLPIECLTDIENVIFTSQNAVKAFFENVPSRAIDNCFCVGKKTQSMLEENGQNDVKKNECAIELAD